MVHPSARRDLLKWLAAGSAALWLPGTARSQARITSNPFTLGVASGAPEPDGVVLWTRLLPQGLFSSLGKEPVNVRWEVAHDDQFKQIVQQGQVVAAAELAHAVHIEVAGLAPNRWYFYRFHAGDFTSGIARTRTLPAPDAQVDKFRLAFASCQRWEHGFYSAHRHMSQEQLDLVLFLGDYIYEYPAAANAVRNTNGRWVQTLDDYRARYALHKSDADLQAAHAACPWAICWDDHEVHNDYTGETQGFTSNAEPAPSQTFVQRRASAYQAWYEHMPVRASVLTRALAGLQQGAEMRIYQNLRWGQLANLYVLDPRQYKDANVCTRDGRAGSSRVDPATCAPWADPNRSLLGKTQETWLDAQLGQSQTGWQVLGQSSLLGPRDFRSGPQKSFWNDGWDGYPAARSRLTDALRKNLTGKTGRTAVVLGGDVHENWVGHVKADYNDAKSANVGVEFCGAGISSRSSNAARTVVDGLLAENPHFTFADNRSNGYSVCEFTPTSLTTQLRAVDDVTRRDAAVATLAAFEVKAGRAVAERV